MFRETMDRFNSVLTTLKNALSSCDHDEGRAELKAEIKAVEVQIQAMVETYSW